MIQAELVHACAHKPGAQNVEQVAGSESFDLSSPNSFLESGLTNTQNAAKSHSVDSFLAQLLHLLGPDTYQLWFGPQTQVHFNGQSVCVQASSQFLVDCIKSFCLGELHRTAQHCFGVDTRVVLEVSGLAPASESVDLTRGSTKPAGRPASQPQSQNNLIASQSRSAENNRSRQSDKLQKTSAENQVARVCDSKPTTAQLPAPQVNAFFVGSSNRLAAAATDMVIDKPGEFGLLFVYGPNGVGKTHLCRSLRERLKLRHGLRRVMYMTAEQFTIDFSESTRGAGFAAFRKKYRDVDALILDDAQFFLGKHQTLAELRNTIDDLLARRRQVVLTADRPLSELVAMGSDLHARLSGGVSCCMEVLDQGLRRTLLEDICKRHDVQLASATIDALSSRSSGDGRALYGLAFRLLTQQRVAGGKLSHEQALSCTNDLLQASKSVVRLNDIERLVCDSFGLEPKALRAKTRGKSVTAARMLAMFLARKHTAAAFSEIGEYFGNRQHSTVISAQKRVSDWLNSNEPLSHRAGTISVRDWVRNAEATLRVG